MKNNLRDQFVNSLIKLAKKDKNIMLLTGDLGYSFLERFSKQFPNQFINCGLIEQTMIGIAGGLALSGKKPYVYSASTFLIFRALEQIRNDICYHNLNVKLVGTAGLQYNFLGLTHLPQNKEDVKMLKMFPNVKIYQPKNNKQAKDAVLKSYKLKSPAYIRI